MHRSADEKSGVKIIHRKSSVGWVAKVESRTPSMSGFVLSKLLALGHRGEEEDNVLSVNYYDNDDDDDDDDHDNGNDDDDDQDDDQETHGLPPCWASCSANCLH